jgi:polysaccharide biosynthesis transport protein
MADTKSSSSLLAALVPLSIARMLWKRKWPILIFWVLIACSSAVIVRKLPTLYSAEALILVDAQKIPEKFVTSTVSTDVQDRLASISQQILSSTRLKKIIDDFDLYREERKSLVQEEILEKMRNDISIRLERGWIGNRPGAFRIGYQGPDPAVVAQVANRIANLYIEENLKTREVQAEGTSEFIDTQLQESKKRLDQLEKAVSDYKIQHNGELPQQESAISGILSRMYGELQANRDVATRAQDTRNTLEGTLRIAEATLTALQQSAQQPEQASPATVSPAATPPKASARPRTSDSLRAQLETLRVRYNEQHPDVKRLRIELAKVQALEQQEEQANLEAAPSSGTTPSVAPRPASPDRNRMALEITQAADRVSTLRTQITTAAREYDKRRAEEQRLSKEIANLEARLSRLPVREQEMAQITRDYEISKANYRSLLDKKFSAEMSTDMERRQKSERFTVIDPARVPEKPFKPNRPLLYSMGIFAGLLIGLAVGVSTEMRQNVILGEWELPAGTPILGRLPHIELGMPATVRLSGGHRALLKRRLRILLVSSALFSILCIAAVGIYFIRGRF